MAPQNPNSGPRRVTSQSGNKPSGISKMISEKQLEANRGNALLSTGPKTDEGKKRSSLNARRHGIRSGHDNG